MHQSSRYRRGYPVALLVAFVSSRAVLWKIYSHVVKPERTITFAGSWSDAKVAYNFYEAVVNAMRPTLREGTKSIIVVSPPRTNFTSQFLDHVRSHHPWLTQGGEKATFAQIAGSAITAHEVTVLTRSPEFKNIVSETTTQETENLLEILEKSLNASSSESLVLYSLEEIEDKIFGTWLPSKPKPDYLLLVDNYLARTYQKGRMQRLIQVAANRKVKSRIVEADSPAGKRLQQLGGIICILKQA